MKTITAKTISTIALAAALSVNTIYACTYNLGYITTTLPDNKQFSHGVQIGTRAEESFPGISKQLGLTGQNASKGPYLSLETSTQSFFQDGTPFGYGLTPGIIFWYDSKCVNCPTGPEIFRDRDGRSLEFQLSPAYVMMKDGKVTLTPKAGLNFDWGNVYIRAGADFCYGDKDCKVGMYGGSGLRF